MILCFEGESVVAWWQVAGAGCGTTMLENNDAAFPALVGLQEKTRRRQLIARHVHNVWTLSSSEIAGLASPIFDGRFDVLSSYVIEYYEAFSNDTRHLPFRTAEDVLSDENEIDHVHAHDLTYQDFCQKFMFKNLPVVIRGLADTWPCFRNWTKQDCNNLTVPNLSYLKERFGDDVVSVHKQLCHGFSCPQLRPEVSESCEMTLSEYVEWWTRYSNDSTDQPLLYLKDWKFASLHPYYDAYSCPTLFLDDWLNEAKNGMYRFVYLGPKGTATALHADVLRSFSWSTNVCGQKRWRFIPPLYAHLLYDCFGAKLAYHLFADVSMENGGGSVNFMSTIFPGLRIARQHAITVVQDAGDTIFVPSNWFHTVENIADTLSINHNWLNGANLGQCWNYVNSEVRSSTLLRSSESSVSSENLRSGSSSAAKVNDVALSFWYVVGAKAKEFSQLRLDESGSPTFKTGLDGILLVIDGLLHLERDGFVSMSALNDVHDIYGLRRDMLNLRRMEQ